MDISIPEERTKLFEQLHEARERFVKLSSTAALSARELRDTASCYQQLCSTYGYLDTFFPDTAETRETRALVIAGRRALYSRRLEEARTTERISFWKRVPAAFFLIRVHILVAALVFVGSGIGAALLVKINPHFGWNFLSPEMAEGLRQGRLWTERIQGMSSVASSQIATNNILVTFSAFAFGITAGVGTVLILITNGAMLGGVLIALQPYGMVGALLTFIVSHGFLELSIIVVAAGCGLYLGDALIAPGELSRKEALQRRARPAFDLMFFSALGLLLAGIVEGYISPDPRVPFSMKLLVGIALGTVYWSYLLFGNRKKHRVTIDP